MSSYELIQFAFSCKFKYQCETNGNSLPGSCPKYQQYPVNTQCVGTNTDDESYLGKDILKDMHKSRRMRIQNVWDFHSPFKHIKP